MGKSPKPLSFCIDPRLVQATEDRLLIEALKTQGHTFYDYMGVSGDLTQVDIIMGPNAWRAFDLIHLDLAMKSARAVKYVKKSEAKPKKPRAPRKKKSDAGPESE